MKKEFLARCRIYAISCVLCVAALSLESCESERFSHEPPLGCGSLIVDNRTGDRLLVYIDGRSMDDVDRYDYEIYDMNPDVIRVVIDERNGFRNWRGDVDILEGQLTVMEIDADYISDEYTALIYFD